LSDRKNPPTFAPIPNFFFPFLTMPTPVYLLTSLFGRIWPRFCTSISFINGFQSNTAYFVVSEVWYFGPAINVALYVVTQMVVMTYRVVQLDSDIASKYTRSYNSWLVIFFSTQFWLQTQKSSHVIKYTVR